MAVTKVMGPSRLLLGARRVGGGVRHGLCADRQSADRRGRAAEFLAYVDNPDLPDPEVLLNDPDRFAELERTDQQLAALDAVAAVAVEDPNRWRDAFKVCIAAANAGAGDIATSTAMRLVEHKPPSQRLPAGFEAFTEILTQAGILNRADTDSGSR